MESGPTCPARGGVGEKKNKGVFLGKKEKCQVSSSLAGIRGKKKNVSDKTILEGRIKNRGIKKKQSYVACENGKSTEKKGKSTKKVLRVVSEGGGLEKVIGGLPRWRVGTKGGFLVPPRGEVTKTVSTLVLMTRRIGPSTRDEGEGGG